MDKFLRVLVIVFLVFSIAALVLGIMLFVKRELLKGRTQKLEKTVKALDAVIEAEPGVVELKPEYPAKDIDECTPEIPVEPERSEFWEKYKHDLEMQEPQAMLDTSGRDMELMTYYKRDPVTRKIIRDPATGYKLTTGDGTMQAVLDSLLSKAEEQYNRLNETRQQLTDLREELVDTIKELNKRKGFLRERLKEIVELKAEIQRLEGEIRMLKEQIAELEEEKRQLEDKVTEQERQIALLEEEKEELKRKNTVLEEENKKLRESYAGLGRGEPVPLAQAIEPGVKGKVSVVNPQWKFVVLELSDKFLREILGDDLSGDVPMVDLYIKQSTKPEKFVTKVRLMQLRKDKKLGVADVLTDWQQLPVRKGDIVFY